MQKDIKRVKSCEICPVCNIRLAEDSENSLFAACKSCGLVLNKGYMAGGYSDNYFTDDYRNQYGKSYEEDFPAIYNDSERRIKKIQAMLIKRSGKDMSVLDVGCALGFFLKAAEDSGATKLAGIEISEYAVNYIRETYKYAVSQCSFEEYKNNQKFDVVSAWYFVEHTSCPIETINRLAGMRNKGGILAFSVPSVFGPMYRNNRTKWLKTHPQDHAVDFTPRAVKKILKSLGFSKIRIIPASYHPERLFYLQKQNGLRFRMIYYFYRSVARLFSYGDTIEVYAK
ncbi:MAG: class I SAM-dependent methyltransferase [Spirochaetes bacterium]|nr:class I SAM-dependent methyltransferase [Spirochaetota bacterium]